MSPNNLSSSTFRILVILLAVAAGSLADESDYQMVVTPAVELEKRLSLGAPTHIVRESQHTGARHTDLEYMDIEKGKEHSPLREYPEYHTRLMDFYKRQARYYLRYPDQVQPLLPGFPALDGGLYGHHGKYNKNGVSTTMRDEMDQGWVLQYAGPNRLYGIHLGNDRASLLLYDSTKCQPSELLDGGRVDYDDYRYSTARQAKAVGESRFQWKAGAWGKEDPWFLGHYRYHNEAVFRYRVEDREVLEAFHGFEFGEHVILFQGFHFPGGTTSQTYSLADPKGVEVKQAGDLRYVVTVESKEGEVSLIALAVGEEAALRDGAIHFPASADFKHAGVVSWRGRKADLEEVLGEIGAHRNALDEFAASLPSKTSGSTTLTWPHVLEGAGELSDEDAAYVIDTLPIPLVNPYRSPLFLTGIAFDPEGNAYVTTLFGDVWKVSGIDEELQNVTWKRLIAGLNSPFGIIHEDGVLYVGDKAELIALHDLNGDDEIDYVERANQAFRGFGRNVHSGLVKDREGYSHYITSSGLARLKDDEYEVYGPPLRTAFAIGITHDDRVWAAPQEGGGTPASAIFEFHEGDDLYRPKFGGTVVEAAEEMKRVDPALVYLPRGLDNSTGGAAPVTSDRFGVLGDKMLNLSYGACAVQYILRDRPPGAERFQGAAVPLPGYFYSGVNHAATNPKDGQVYVVGHDGWGTYAVTDGNLQRYRYTGKKAAYPTGFRVFDNGIQLDFEEPLEPDLVKDPKAWFAQQWNYTYSPAYGSPEYSVNDPDKLGHDHLPVKAVEVRKGGKQLFLEMPSIRPAMTIHLYTQVGESDEIEMFLTALQLARSGEEVEEKPRKLTLPHKMITEREKFISPDQRRKAKHVYLGSNDTLQFLPDEQAAETLKNVHVGDLLLFQLENTGMADGMAHNAVVMRAEDMEAVGMAADAIVADKDAVGLSYVPIRVPEVRRKILAYSTLAFPGQTKEFIFETKSPGKYTILCTFPGHWRLMKYDFEVKPKVEHAFASNRSALHEKLARREDISFLKGESGKPYVHFFAAEAEYGAFYSMPMLAELLNTHYGFTVSVSYSLDSDGNVDSRVADGLKGFELMREADLVVFFTRTKNLTKETSKLVQAYLDSGKPIVGFRTANHGFRFEKEDEDADYLQAEGWSHKGPQLCHMWKHLFGGHHGGSPKDGDLTAIFRKENESKHPILRGFEPYRDPRHLYILLHEPGEEEFDFTPLVHGRALKIFPHKAHLPEVQPTVIVSETERRMVYSSTCGADTFKHASARRLALNSVFWALRMEDQIPREGLKVELVRPYDPPHDTHLRKDYPHRGKPGKVFTWR